MARYRAINPKGEVVEEKDIESADKAHAWLVDQKANDDQLGWRLEVNADGDWRFFGNTDGTPSG